MLSRVADSLYWMSRYFERAENCARVLEATYNLMLNPARLAPDHRWHRALIYLGLPADQEHGDPQGALLRLAGDAQLRASLVSCISAARENAGQVREVVSSEMWERLNRLFHEVTKSVVDDEESVMNRVAAVREAAYSFHGITDATMNHGEGWHFIRLGKFTERACALCLLLDAYFSTRLPADDLDWISLLTSCAAFEAYCKACTADLKPERIAAFLLLEPEFPYSVRYATDRMQTALNGIGQQSPTGHTGEIERIIGRLRASLTYAKIGELIAGDLHVFLNSIVEQCGNLHSAVQEVYIDYPVEAALEI